MAILFFLESDATIFGLEGMTENPGTSRGSDFNHREATP